MKSVHMILCLLKPDEKVSVTMTMFAANLQQAVEDEKEVDAVLDMLRMQLKYGMKMEAGR